MKENKPISFRSRVHEVIYEADTRGGKIFDVIILWMIAISVLLIMADSVKEFHERFETEVYYLEWFFTIAFTIEYLLRIYAVKKPWNYILSFYGIVDLLSILPTYLGFFFVDGSSFRAIRILRMMRIFRVLKLISFVKQASVLKTALRNSRDKILVFLFAIGLLVVVLGTIMYIIESEESGFTSIPMSIYWAIVTITTVGYGDIAPATALGQTIASVIMILGYAIIAVPTGIVTSELNEAKSTKLRINTQNCPSCAREGHDRDAKFCKHCGEQL